MFDAERARVHSARLGPGLSASSTAFLMFTTTEIVLWEAVERGQHFCAFPQCRTMAKQFCGRGGFEVEGSFSGEHGEGKRTKVLHESR